MGWAPKERESGGGVREERGEEMGEREVCRDTWRYIDRSKGTLRGQARQKERDRD